MNQRSKYSFLISFLFTALIIVGSGCIDSEPIETDKSTPSSVETTFPDTTLEFQDPPVPESGGTGLPETNSSSNEEIDCNQAEDLCDSGVWACDDIADYCDIGPDDGSELPDDWDWDQ